MNKFLRWSVIVLFILLAASLVFGSLVPLASASISYGSVSSGANSSSGATTLVLNKPSSTASGDFLLAGISFHGGDDVTLITAPSGWTLVERTDNDDKVGIATYYKFAGSSEGSTYTWTLSSSKRAAGGIIRYTGVDTSSPINVEGEDDGSDDKFNAPSVTTTVANTTVVVFYSHDDDKDHPTPSDAVERYDTENSDNDGPRISASDFTQVSAGATGVKTIDSDGSGNADEDWVAQTIALKPAVTLTAQTITVTTNAPASATYGDTFPVAATAGSGLTVAITTTGGCSIDAGTVTMTSGTTSCVVKYNQEGDETYSAAPEVTETVTADKAALAITSDDTSKTYGDTVTFAGTEFTTGDLVAGDSVTSVTLASSGAAANATVSGSPYSITGSDAVGTGLSNYTITYNTGTLTVDQKDVSVSATGVNKEYDTTTDADVIPLVDGVVEGADVDVTYTAAFTDPNVGTEITVNVTDMSLTGDDSGNYNLTNTTTSTEADITEATATVTLDEEQDLTVTYDGSQKPLTFSTTPEDLDLLVTYDGDTDAPTNAGEYTVIATVTDSNYAGSEEVTLTIEKADAEIEVSGYEVTYDGESHTATGSAMGVGEDGELEGLDLSDTTHTNAGSYEDEWTFTDSTGNYNDASGSVESLISQAEADIEVSGYSVTYDGESHTATGSAMGVGEDGELEGLSLSGTIHTEIGSYEDEWSFTDVTGNYEDASGSVSNTISAEDEEQNEEEENTHTLTYTAGANGSIGGTATQTVDDGATGSAVSAIAEPGYTFVNWSDGSVMNPRIETNVTSDISMTASFAKLARGGGRSFTGATGAAQAPGQVLGASTSTLPVGQVLGETTFLFTKNLWYRMPRNTDVSELQKFLVGKGYSIPDAVTTFFGPQTLAAVKAFQKDNGVNPTGFVGPLTLELLNKTN